MPYIGHNPTQAGSFVLLDDIASGFDGSDVTFTLQIGGVDITPTADNLIIALDGVMQHSPEAYSVSGSTLTFTAAPASGVDFYGMLMGQSASIGQGAIGADELSVTGDGSANQMLVSDGDGTMTWKGSGISATSATGDLIYRNSSGELARLAVGSAGQVLTVASGLPAWETDVESYLPLSGGTMSGALNMGSQAITNGGSIAGTFTGNLTGDVTGNVTGNTSGTAATVTGAAQSSITSVGTLTSLAISNSSGNSYGLNAYHSSANTSQPAHLIWGNSAGNTKAVLRVQENATRSDTGTPVFEVVATGSNTSLLTTYASGRTDFSNGMIVTGNATFAGAVGVGGVDATTYSNNGDNFVIYEASTPGMTIAGGSDNVGRIFFADEAHDTNNGGWAGYMDYSHSTNKMTFGTANVEALGIDSSQNATFAGNVTSNTGKFYAPANVNLVAYSRNTKVIEYLSLIHI